MDNSHVARKIRKLLMKYNVPTDLPLDKDAVLSGSFLWHALTADKDTKWEPNDVDIFCLTSAMPRFREYFISKGFSLSSIEPVEFERIRDEENPSGTSIKYVVERWLVPFPQEEIKSLNDSLCEDNDLPLIQGSYRSLRRPEGYCMSVKLITSTNLEVKVVSDLIVGRFSLPTLENYFDGEHLMLTYPDLVAKRESYNEGRYYLHWKYRDYGLKIIEKPVEPRDVLMAAGIMLFAVFLFGIMLNLVEKAKRSETLP